MRKAIWKTGLAGAAAGIVNGLFGAGGGMVLIPLLTAATDFADEDIFPTSLSIMLPMCLVSLAVGTWPQPLTWQHAAPYLMGSAIGGVLAGIFGKHIPTRWLHRILGGLILYGGWRYLC